MTSFENKPSNNRITPKIQEYIDRINSGNETLVDFGDIPESWKAIILKNTENAAEDDVNEVVPAETEIQIIFDRLNDGIRKGLKDNFQEKVERYVNEINSGKSKEVVLDGLSSSFVNAVEDQLKPKNEIISVEGREISLENLKNLNQMDFALWLQGNKDSLEKLTKETVSFSGKQITKNPIGESLGYYNLLTLRPEYRSQAILDLNAVVRKPDFDTATEYYRTTRSEEEKYTNSDSNPDWLQFNFGDTRNTEEDGMRRKGYITIDTTSLDVFESKVKDVIYDLQNILPGKYNGSFKVSQNLSKLLNQFDNIVIHGGNEEEVDNALGIISDVLGKNGIKNEIAQKGKDGKDKNNKKTSHTRLLEEKIINNEL